MSQEELITIVGRGNSGTRVLSHTLLGSGVFLGRSLNAQGDTLPPDSMYAACHVIARHVRWNGGLSWDFDSLHSMPVEPEFEDLVNEYLKVILTSERPQRGWKLPETTLAYPWIVRMFPAAKYVHLVRDPRDSLLRRHITDDLRRCSVDYQETDDVLAQRVASWKYQHEIVRATPQPEQFMTVRFEDLVLDREATMQCLEDFLGIPLARIVMNEARVGVWKTDGSLLPYIEPLKGDMRELGYEI